jgi:hypothetical protein
VTAPTADYHEPVAEYTFGRFGTIDPSDGMGNDQWPHAGKAGASILLTGVALLGGFVGTSIGGGYGTPTPGAIVSRTDRGVLAPLLQPTPVQVARHTVDVGQRANAIESRADRDEVAWTKDHSGFTWEQLGKVFGVSRRAVHMWANGGRLNEQNARRLRTFSALVREIEAETPGATAELVRSQLLHVGSDGLSVVDRLRRERSSGPTWGAPFGPDHLVGATREALRTPVGETGR